jgi:hypothetical protein
MINNHRHTAIPVEGPLVCLSTVNSAKSIRSNPAHTAPMIADREKRGGITSDATIGAGSWLDGGDDSTFFTALHMRRMIQPSASSEKMNVVSTTENFAASGPK